MIQLVMFFRSYERLCKELEEREDLITQRKLRRKMEIIGG
jgi:hypothetical protein